MVNSALYSYIDITDNLENRAAFHTNVELIWRHLLKQSSAATQDIRYSDSLGFRPPPAKGCLAILWAREVVNLDACALLLTHRPGINTVEVSASGPCLLTIGYDRNRASAQEIQRYAKLLGMDVRLVGC